MKLKAILNENFNRKILKAKTMKDIKKLYPKAVKPRAIHGSVFYVELEKDLWAKCVSKNSMKAIEPFKIEAVYKMKGRKQTFLWREGQISEGVYDNILKAVPDSYSYKALAVDIAKMIKDEYGSHNIKPFMKELSKLLKEGVVNESLGINDPVLVAIRAMKTQMKKKTPVNKIKKVSFDQYLKLIGIQEDLVEDLKDTAEDIQDLFRNMEQEAEPSGGPVADKYGAQLDKLEKKYADLKKKKAVVDKKIESYRMS